MNLKFLTRCAVIVFLMTSSSAMAQSVNAQRDNSDTSKMFHKLGRGVVNVLTCWVEVPRQIAIEWERTDPVTGLITGTIKGAGWGFARFATGVYEVYTFPLPVPADYEVMIEPEFIIEDTWGAPIPGLNDITGNRGR